MVVGCSGSGKSWFSKRLRDLTGLPLYHLDMIWHKPDRTTVMREEFDAKLSKIVEHDEWIIDGNFNRTLELRMSHCDTVILFDLPTELCLDGVRSRIGKPRDDMPWVEQELDPEFEAWIRDFREQRLPKIYELIEKYRESCETVVFRTREESERFLEELKQ